ncbi:hypothetical protein ACFWGM_02400 [Streptomyces roseolus]|uniref:hypothetical protein n=1 Tax=Streptomyces roseolus TaxID=67358 RepID=UPI003657A592
MKVLFLVQVGEPEGYGPESGRRFARGPDGGGETHGGRGGASFEAVLGGPQEHLVGQVGDQRAEFREAAGDGDGVG